MYIKHRNKNKDITIINVNISSCSDIVVENNQLVINMEDEKDTVKISLESNDSAKLAQEKLFITLGLKAPYNNVLDLTKLNVLESNDMVGLTLQDIADKFKLDVRDLSIVATNSLKTNIESEIEIDEEENVR